MKKGDLVKHSLFPTYGVGVVLNVYCFSETILNRQDIAIVMFPEFMYRGKFKSEHLEAITI